MNFFGHATVAVAIDPDPHFVLGSMLPDFASMSRGRLGDVAHPRVATGVACHHRTDTAFHRAPAFRSFCAEGAPALEAAGVGSGTAAAVAHVGTELLLDGLLLHREDAAAAYRAALAIEGDLGIELARGSEADLDRVLGRLREIDLPTDYASPAAVAGRLRQILAPRPRLAMADGDEDRILPWLTRTRAALGPLVGPLLAEVIDAARLG